VREAAPYLSVVVTSRNDDHGGNPLGRFQAFINCLVAQCRRAELPAELIVVEWNPPAERPRLSEVLHWPSEPSPCAVRFIEVPSDLHQTLKHADALPLFQMIAKNVGIRRARGRFVLSTNIDILLSNELVDYIAAGRLQPRAIYRVDRHDVDNAVPIDASLDEIMAYCRTHQLRRNTSRGTILVAPTGEPMMLASDIIAPDSGIRLGDGWHMREGVRESPYRWATRRAELVFEERPLADYLNIEVRPNPYDAVASADLRVVDERGASLSSSENVSGRHVIRVKLPAESRRIWLEDVTPEGERDILALFEARGELRYQVDRIWWEHLDTDGQPKPPDYDYPLDGWQASSGTAARAALIASGLDVVTETRHPSYAIEYLRLRTPAQGVYYFSLIVTAAAGLHFNALSGDRRQIGKVVEIRALKDGRQEHRIAVELPAGQWFTLAVSNDEPAVASKRFVVNAMRGSAPYEKLRASDAPSSKKPILKLATSAAYRITRRIFPKWRRMLGEKLNPEPRAISAKLEATAAERDKLQPLTVLHEFLESNRAPSVHANACGDFQLMARDDWYELRGFPEFEIFSMNIDGLFQFTAVTAGIRELVFHDPLCAYHIEHDSGSGWTPEGEAALRKRVAERGIPWLDHRLVMVLGSYMKSLDSPMIFNGSNWGFGEVALTETTIDAAPTARLT